MRKPSQSSITPFDEDFGYVTLEAFLSRKPVITATDSGGPLEFVDDGVNGSIIAPQPESLADAINRYAADRRRAAHTAMRAMTGRRSLRGTASSRSSLVSR